MPAASSLIPQAGAQVGIPAAVDAAARSRCCSIVTQEMCSRMGAVTGKGLSDLIREEFGLRITFFMMAAAGAGQSTNVMAEFAGIASSLELFHISRYISVPLSAVAVWLLIVKGNYRSVEKIFLFACVLYVAYIISGILVKPDWKEAAIYSVKPVLMLEPSYIDDADRHGGHLHRALDAVLPAGRGSGERHHGEGIRRVPDGGDRRLHRDVGHRVLHHRGLRRRHLVAYSRGTSRRRRCGGRA